MAALGWNTLAAGATLAKLNLLRRNRWIGAALVALGVLVYGLLLDVFAREVRREGQITDLYTNVLSSVIVPYVMPFLSVLLGVGVLSVEIENKTLVYLFTRPAGRARIMLAKLAYTLGALLLYIFLLLVLVQVVARLGVGPHLRALLLPAQAVRIEAPLPAPTPFDFIALLWDMRALALGVAVYGSLGFLLSSLLKRPLPLAIVYIAVLERLLGLIPSNLQRLSLRSYLDILSPRAAMAATSTSTSSAEGPGIAQFLASMPYEKPSEGEALATMIILALIFLISGGLVVRWRQYLSDDPKRTS